jgi:hypothetical protein
VLRGAGRFAWGEALYRQEPWKALVIVCIGPINIGLVLGITGAIVAGASRGNPLSPVTSSILKYHRIRCYIERVAASASAEDQLAFQTPMTQALQD